MYSHKGFKRMLVSQLSIRDPVTSELELQKEVAGVLYQDRCIYLTADNLQIFHHCYGYILMIVRVRPQYTIKPLKSKAPKFMYRSIVNYTFFQIASQMHVNHNIFLTVPFFKLLALFN